ncbi:Alpha-tectorin [Varanus komodoensis]|nr:Alpha-tectorin [Varanus komodoensis]
MQMWGTIYDDLCNMSAHAGCCHQAGSHQGCSHSFDSWSHVGTKVITANCREQCVCQRLGRVVCTPLPCAAAESCVLSNGKWSCARQEGHCTITQGHIFTTYDGVSGKVPSDGSYEITALVNAKSKSWFRVVVQLKKCPQCPTPLVVAVTVYFHKLIVLLKQDSSVSVNGHPVTLPAQPSREVSVSQAQDMIIVTQGTDLKVLYSTRGDLTVALSGTLANKVFRSCGNFNGNGADDLRLPNGRIAHTITEVISHWSVTTAMQNGLTELHSVSVLVSNGGWLCSFCFVSVAVVSVSVLFCFVLSDSGNVLHLWGGLPFAEW